MPFGGAVRATHRVEEQAEERGGHQCLSAERSERPIDTGGCGGFEGPSPMPFGGAVRATRLQFQTLVTCLMVTNAFRRSGQSDTAMLFAAIVAVESPMPFGGAVRATRKSLTGAIALAMSPMPFGGAVRATIGAIKGDYVNGQSPMPFGGAVRATK